jgi:UDP-N-acetylmuramate--alanine ligase
MARKEFPDKKLVVAFHPHLYSRTRDLMDGFVEALLLADEVLLAPIYPAREDPIPGVTSEVLAEKISAHGTPATAHSSFDELALVLRSENAHCPLPTAHSVLITMGAGDIYQLAEQLAG